MVLNVLGSCAYSFKDEIETIIDEQDVTPGINQPEDYLQFLKGRNVAIVANQTSTFLNGVHLVDSLLTLDITISKVFSPEHGFRGKADAGEKVNSTNDPTTGLPIVSLYGNNKKPTNAQLEGVDVIVFDLQDVGVRFYTYISTLHYVMEAAAEMDIEVIVLDRPNPNGHYVDGPVLQKEFTSFVGMHPVPIVYGMTIGEYAKMINGEKWLNDSLACELKVVELLGYNHKSKYRLPIAPSPNLKSEKAINLYPSLCLFEGTIISVGRGTETPFEVYGHPNFKNAPYEFTPESTSGASNPKLKNELCHGYNLQNEKYLDSFSLKYILNGVNQLKDQTVINNRRFFNLLAGNAELASQIENGLTENEIRKTWQEDLLEFRLIRSKYLLYD